MIAGGDGRGDGVGDQRRADREAAAEGLGHRHQVGRQAERREREHLAGAADAALDLVGDEQRAGPLARLLDGLGQRRRDRPHAAFALDRLDDDRRRLAGDQPIERRRIVGRRERDAGQQRLERAAVVVVPGHRQRAERAPGEGVIEGHELGARLAARVPVAARELQAGLVGFAAAVAEEGAAQARGAGQAIGELPLQRVEEQVRRVGQLARLRADGVGDAGAAVAERGDADARQQIQVGAALGVEQADAFAADERHRETAVRLQDVPRFARLDVARGRGFNRSAGHGPSPS